MGMLSSNKRRKAQREAAAKKDAALATENGAEISQTEELMPLLDEGQGSPELSEGEGAEGAEADDSQAPEAKKKRSKGK